MDSKYLESMEELGLQPGFTLEELKKKWRELSKKYHSDKHAQADDVLRELAEEKMKKINEAYSYLEKNFGNSNNSSNTSNNENMNTKSENTIRFSMSNGEAIEYFSFYLADLKKELKKKFQPLATKIFEDYSEELSDKFDDEPIYEEVIVLKDMTEEFFAKNLLKINAIKESDKIFLEKSIVKINTLIRKVDNQIEESTYDFLLEEYGNKNFALLGAYRHYLFIEKIKQWAMEIGYCIDKHFRNIDNANYTMRRSKGIGESDEYLNYLFLYKEKLKSIENAKKEEERARIKDNNQNSSTSNNKALYIILPIIGILVLGVILYFAFFKENNDYQEVSTQSTTTYSQPQAQQEEVKPTVVENNNINKNIPTVEDARYVNYKTYYNDNFDYSIDYPDDEYFQISKTYEDGMKLQNDNGEVLISLTSNWNPNGESLQQAYDKAVREKPNAAYKFLGKTFFTITYEDNGLLIFRKTMYDKDTNKYVYLYVSFPPEYKPYMTPIVERMANSMKKSSSTQSNTNTSNVTYSNYYNSYYGYSVDYPTSSDFYISSNTNDGIEIKSNDENVYISVVYSYDEYGDNLQQAYNRAVSEYPNAPYKFLGKTFFTITYQENGLLVFRKTVYDKINNGYIYLYVSFPPEYKEYMSPIVEKMANTMKKR